MTRVVYWNINNFSQNKIYDTTSILRRIASRDRLNYILTVITQNPPDVFIIAEVYDRTPEVGYQGIPVNAGRRVGVACLRMLRKIRRALGAQWMMVPPLKVGNYGFREAVAVYYDSTAVTFAGPWVWAHPAALGLNSSTDPAIVNSAALRSYAAVWRAGLPVPGTPFNATFTNGVQPVQEWQGAAQWEFRNAFGNRIDFPAADNRSPYHVTFVDGGGRRVQIYAVHTSPATAVGAVNAMTAIPGIANPAAGEVCVVIGDFNVDSFGVNVAAYNGLKATYDMALDPDFVGISTPAREPYCMTHLIKTALALPYDNTGVPTDPTHNVYPRLGYMGGTAVGGAAATDVGAIDNAFIRYRAPAVRPARYDTTVVNTIVGTPYRALWPAPFGVTADLTDNLAYPTELTTPLPPLGYVPPGPGLVGMMGRLFRAWHEFGVLYSTSDHLPLLVDV